MAPSDDRAPGRLRASPPNITRKERRDGRYHPVVAGCAPDPDYSALVGGYRPLIAPAGGGQGRGTSSAACVQADRVWILLGNIGSRGAMDPKRTPRCPSGELARPFMSTKMVDNTRKNACTSAHRPEPCPWTTSVRPTKTLGGSRRRTCCFKKDFRLSICVCYTAAHA